MKESSFNKIIEDLDTDRSTDERITEKLMNYEVSAADTDQLKITNTISTSVLKRILSKRISRITAAAFIILIIGTTTALAADNLVKSYKAEIEVVPENEVDIIASDRITINQFGEKPEKFTQIIGKDVYQLVDSETITKFKENTLKYGNEVFAELSLPNLIPTYILENYWLKDGYYYLLEGKGSDGNTYKSITGSFTQHAETFKDIYIDFTPSVSSTNNYKIRLVDDNITKENIKTSTYTTKTGLICNIVEDKKNNLITAFVVFDSQSLGNAYYLISFTNIPMEEVEAILESIPIISE